ncbi:MAG: ADP-ribosylglycohydrolase family protein [Candidatus Obscuribacterales bacterium]|nr:ADP-ribosylglycohydrolase family protein [Candidatus Obscuribacterales bacterium]
MELIDKYRGSIFGLAIGDAIGAPLEYQEPGSFEPVTDMTGGGVFRLRAGDWTDDTSMALCMAESLIECRGFDPSDQMERYLKWYHNGHLSSQGWCFDVGTINRKALLTFESTRQNYCGLNDEKSASNGSIMRLAPVPLAFAAQPTKALDYAGDSSRTTHAHPWCIDACRYLAALIIGALHEEVSKEELLSPLYSPVKDYWKHRPLVAEVEAIANGSFKEKEPPEIMGDGEVLNSLEAALWAFYKTDTFEEGCLLAVNLGYDSDTTGAVYGQLAGAFYGESVLPAAWRSRLALAHVIRRYSEQLFALSQTM